MARLMKTTEEDLLANLFSTYYIQPELMHKEIAGIERARMHVESLSSYRPSVAADDEQRSSITTAPIATEHAQATGMKTSTCASCALSTTSSVRDVELDLGADVAAELVPDSQERHLHIKIEEQLAEEPRAEPRRMLRIWQSFPG